MMLNCLQKGSRFTAFAILLLALFAEKGLTQPTEGRLEDLLELGLAELTQIKVSNLGSLTRTTRHKTPAAVTQITSQQIAQTAARSLQELLDIHVPGVQWARHHWEPSHLGTRGIISDREDKVMIRVNGRVMNERTHVGAVTERNLPMLSDIDHINVIRGPGSSLFGLGAVSMVIDIHTHSAKTQSGHSLKVSGGIGQEFQSVEARISEHFENGNAIWVYLGAADISGADDEDAPWILGVDACQKSGTPGVSRCSGNPISGPVIDAGHRFPINVNDGKAFQGPIPLKIHVEFNWQEHTDLWLRYTRGGEAEPADIIFAVGPPVGFGNSPVYISEHWYDQFTAMIEHRHWVNKDLKLTGAFSYDTTEIVRSPVGGLVSYQNHREDEWIARLVADWAIHEQSDIAIGIEASYEKFGLDGERSGEAILAQLGEVENPWWTRTYSLFGEWQYRSADEHFTTFIGGRLDKNTYSDVLFSPRVSLVWHPNDETAWKLMLARSQRMNFAEENRAQDEQPGSGSHPDPETLDSLELRYEYLTSDLQFSLSTFVLKLEAIGYSSSEGRSVQVADQKQAGVEIELKKLFGDASVSFSHAYTKLLDFDNKPGHNSLISSEPHDHLNNWSDHITKVRADYQLTPKLNINGSLRVYWDFPGLQDHFDQQIANGSRTISPGWKKGAAKQVFLNLGSSYQFSDSLRANLNLYNLMGLIDKDYNKRIYFNSASDFRSEATSAVISLTAEF